MRQHTVRNDRRSQRGHGGNKYEPEHNLPSWTDDDFRYQWMAQDANQWRVIVHGGKIHVPGRAGGGGLHYDEYLALAMAIDAGQHIWPGLAMDTPITYARRPEDYAGENLKGTLILGVNTGAVPAIDEHHLQLAKGRNVCCATIMASTLDLLERPEWREPLILAVKDDCYGECYPDTLPWLIKRDNRHRGADAEGHKWWLRVIFDWVEDLRLKQPEALRPDLESARNFPIRVENKTYGGVFINTDNPHAASLLFNEKSEPDLHADIVIIANSDGSTRISTHNDCGLTLQQTGKFLSEREPDRWYWEPRMNMVVNGTDYVWREPTMLSPTELINIVCSTIARKE